MKPTEAEPPDFVSETQADEPELAPAVGRLSELFNPASIPAGSLEQLMIEVSQPPLRYAPFFESLSNLWDLPESDVRSLLERSRDKSQWSRAPLPGLELMKLQGGPRIQGTHAYLARFSPGMTFPLHSHDGHEDVLILEGSYTDDRGTEYLSGDVHHMQAGEAHSFTIARDEPCVAAAVHRGIRFRSFGMRLLAKLFGG